MVQGLFVKYQKQHIAYLHTFNIFRLNNLNSLKYCTPYLKWSELVFTSFDNCVHGVGHGEGVRPIVVWHLSIVLPDGQRKTEQVIKIKPAITNTFTYVFLF